MTISKTRLTSAILLVLLSQTVSASEQGIAIKGGGGITSCSEMLNFPKESVAEYQTRSWILGFISGRNWESISQKGFNIDEDTIFFAVKQYCRENPVDSVVLGAKWLYENHLPDDL